MCFTGMALEQTNLYPFLLCAVLVYGETLTLFAGRISPNAFLFCQKLYFAVITLEQTNLYPSLFCADFLLQFNACKARRANLTECFFILLTFFFLKEKSYKKEAKSLAPS